MRTVNGSRTFIGLDQDLKLKILVGSNLNMFPKPEKPNIE